MSLSKSIAYSWKFYLHLLNTTITAASLAYLGNAIAQKVFEKQPKMNHKRALKFVVFSIILTPISQLFPKKEEKKDDDGKTRQTLVDSSAIKKLLLDELLYDPFCLILFFTVIGILDGKSTGEIVGKIRQDWWPTQKMSWRVWPAVQLINFMVIPGYARILFINLVSFFWGIFLQLKSSK